MSSQSLSTDLLFSRFANLVDHDIDKQFCSLGFFGDGLGNALPSDISGLDILLPDSAVVTEWSHSSNLKESEVQTENRTIAVDLKPVGGVEFDAASGFYWNH